MGKLWQGAGGDSSQAEGPTVDSVPGHDRDERDQGSERTRDEEDADLVGSHVVRDRRRHWRRNIRTYRNPSQGRRRAGGGAVVRRFRHLRHALRLLLH